VAERDWRLFSEWRTEFCVTLMHWGRNLSRGLARLNSLSPRAAPSNWGQLHAINIRMSWFRKGANTGQLALREID